MMRANRTVGTAIALALLVLGATSASAARRPPPKPKPVCDLLLDESGDGKMATNPAVSSKAIDIVGGDVATGPTTMVAVLRLSSTNMTPAADHFSNAGYGWSLSTMSSLGQLYVFSASRDLLGNMLHKITVDGEGVPPASVSFTITPNSFVWTMKRSASKNLGRSNNVFSQVSGQTTVLSGSADTAAPNTRTYKDKALSCVAAK